MLTLSWILEGELLQCAMEDGALSEEAGVRTRRSGDFLLQRPQTQGSKACLPHSRGTPSHISKVITPNAWCVRTGQSGCVQAICGLQGNKTCYPSHLHDIISGFLEERTVQWPRGKKARVCISRLLVLKYLEGVMGGCRLLYPCGYVT
jgi:hypothetical protein